MAAAGSDKTACINQMPDPCRPKRAMLHESGWLETRADAELAFDFFIEVRRKIPQGRRFLVKGRR